MSALKLNILAVLCFLLAFGLFPVRAMAQDAGSPAAAPVVVELFSSQACTFCPKADQLLSDLLKSGEIIGIACHVDYFDVREGSMAKPFCTQRQTEYGVKLRSGPNYTPQMVVNGAHDVVGYRMQDVTDVIKEAKQNVAGAVRISKMDAKDMYKIVIPEVGTQTPLEAQIVWLDKPHRMKIAEGGNRGKTLTYYNIADRLEPLSGWSGNAGTLEVEIALKNQHKGFVVLTRESESGEIVAAGEYVRPDLKAGPKKGG